MRNSTFLKSFLLLCALIVGSSNAWAGAKPWSGDDPESTLDLQTITSSTMGSWNDAMSWYLDDDYLIVSGYASYKSVDNQTWITQVSVGSNEATWGASEPFKGSSYYTTNKYATIQSGRYLLYKVTNLKSLKVYGKNNAVTKYLDIFIYTKSGDDYTKVEEIKYTADNAEHIWQNNTTLDTDETYFIYITGVGSSNSRVFEVAFERNTVVDNRENAGLAYAVTDQTVAVGNMLAAPTLTNPHGLSVTYESGDKAIATVDEEGNVTGVAKGITTITAKFAGNSTYKPGSASYAITVIKAKPAGALFWESMSGYTGSTDVGTELTITYTNLDSEDWDSFNKVYAGKVLSGDTDGHLKFGSGSYAGTAVTKAIALTGTGKLTYKVQRYDSNNAGNLKITVTGGATATGDVDVTGTAAWVEKTVYLANAEGNVVITFATTDADKRIRVDDILVTQITSVSATVTSAGWATWVAPVDVTVPSGVEAYAVALNGTKTELTALTTIPAGTPVLLKNEGTYEFPVATETPAAVTTALKVSDGTVTSADNAFVLASKEQGVGFYRWISTSDFPAIPAGKVYLVYTASGTAPDFIDFGDATGIRMVNDSGFMVNGSEVYNLNGQRVAQPTKGLYIVNGKKVIIK